MSGDELLEVRDLSVDYVTTSGPLRAVDRVSFSLRRGEILGLAGESGSGKSTLTTALLRLERPPAVLSSGEVILHGNDGSVDLTRLDEKQLRSVRWTRLSIVMQSAMNAWNPVKRLETQFRDVLKQHNPGLTTREYRQRAEELLAMVGLPPNRITHFPHEMSGGMRQRALIALALACDPDIIVMDEPTTAVDVVMQRSILARIVKLQRELGFAIIFVTHDLSLLLELADRIAIMYAGKLVEIGSAEAIYSDPKHPYTKALRNAFPPLFAPVRKLNGLPGSPPDLRTSLPGCAFHPRCPVVMDRCREDSPALRPVGEQQVSCLQFDELVAAAPGPAEEQER